MDLSAHSKAGTWSVVFVIYLNRSNPKVKRVVKLLAAFQPFDKPKQPLAENNQHPMWHSQQRPHLQRNSEQLPCHNLASIAQPITGWEEER